VHNEVASATNQGNAIKLKSFVGAAIAAATLSTAMNSASAETVFADPISGSSFTNVVVGTINISTLSNLSGSFFAADSLSFAPLPFSLTLDSVTFTSGTVGSLVDLLPAANDFSFTNVAAGDYVIRASGTLLGDGQFKNFAIIGATYNVTAVPEPETFAMLLAGLGLMGTIARRRNKADVAA
jgi:hypothetical protein